MDRSIAVWRLVPAVEAFSRRGAKIAEMGVVPDCWSKILLGVLGVLAIRLRRTDSNQPLAADVVPPPLKGTLAWTKDSRPLDIPYIV